MNRRLLIILLGVLASALMVAAVLLPFISASDYCHTDPMNLFELAEFCETEIVPIAVLVCVGVCLLSVILNWTVVLILGNAVAVFFMWAEILEYYRYWLSVYTSFTLTSYLFWVGVVLNIVLAFMIRRYKMGFYMYRPKPRKHPTE